MNRKPSSSLIVHHTIPRHRIGFQTGSLKEALKYGRNQEDSKETKETELGRTEYIGINAWFFLVVNLLKVPFQIFAWDNITWSSFSLNLLMLPVIGIGALLGIRIVKLFPEKAFRRFIQIVTILSVAMMLV